MPELPEVETNVQQLKPNFTGKKLIRVETFNSRDRTNYAKSSLGLIIRIWRRAKVVIFDLDSRNHFFIRLGMTGYFSQKEKDHYAQVKFNFHDQTSLLFCDIRKFGSVRLLSETELQKELSRIGPEPFEVSFTPNLLYNLLQGKKKANLKTTLMDQSVIAGIGNIYAQEALYSAGVDPRRKAGSVSFKEAEKIYSSMRLILQKAIAAGGSTVDNYKNLEGSGNFQQQLMAYQKDKCPKQHQLQKVLLGGRGTWFCSICQK